MVEMYAYRGTSNKTYELYVDNMTVPIVRLSSYSQDEGERKRILSSGILPDADHRVRLALYDLDKNERIPVDFFRIISTGTPANTKVSPPLRQLRTSAGPGLLISAHCGTGTLIEVTGASESMVRVFDCAGRRVAKAHTVVAHMRIPAGIYVAEAECDARMLTRKFAVE
jgi:hypothetical protein